MSKKLKRLDLLFREVQDLAAQENFYRIKAYIDSLAGSGIDAITSVLSSLVLGDQFENFEDNTTFTTTAATNQVAASFTTATKQTGKYRIGIEWDWSYDSTGNDSIYSVWVDGVQVSQEFRYELSNATAQLLNNHFSYYETFATIQTHTIELRVRAETAGSTVSVSRVRSEIWRATP